MAIESKDLISEYFEEVKDQYPGIAFERFSVICRAPFLFFRKMMECMDFPLIHVKYFGKFVVWPGNAKKIIDIMGTFLRSGRLTQEQFDEKTKDLREYIDRYEFKKTKVRNIKTYISNYERENQNPPNSQGEETFS